MAPKGRIETASKEEAASLRRLMAEWKNDSPAVHIELARRYTQTYPDNACGWIVLADGLWTLALYADARRALRRADALMPRDRRAHIFVQWGHFHNEKGELKEAEKWYRRAVRKKPTTLRLVFLGAVLAKQGRLREAKECHQNAIKVATHAADEAYLNLAFILRAERKYKEAITCLDKAIRIDPNYGVAKIARKDVLRAMKLQRR